MPAATEDRLLVVSPHLDDAVLSCGCWLASRPGAAVVTVFAGRPVCDGRRKSGAEVVAVR